MEINLFRALPLREEEFIDKEEEDHGNHVRREVPQAAVRRAIAEDVPLERLARKGRVDVRSAGCLSAKAFHHFRSAFIRYASIMIWGCTSVG